MEQWRELKQQVQQEQEALARTRMHILTLLVRLRHTDAEEGGAGEGINKFIA